MEQQKELFSNRNLKAMIVPLFMEQLLVMLVGMADTLVVSYAGRRQYQEFLWSTNLIRFLSTSLRHWLPEARW